ncbi:MAG: methyltransferase domain-containing protein [Candidatus Promineifilaceae bacterium]
MEIDDLHFLLSQTGQGWLKELGATAVTPDNHLQLAERLRGEVTPSQTHAILETILLRQRAGEKFERADEMFFTRPALEQASAEVVSRYRAARFHESGFETVADLGCGIGGDALALAERAAVIGVDRNPVRLAMARENVAVYGSGDAFHPLQADITEMTPMNAAAVFADPGRRDERGRRIYSVSQYRPSLDVLLSWRRQVPDMGIKISPGVDYAELPPDGEIEFISVQGEVREGVLWFGRLRRGVQRQATLLPGKHTLTSGVVSQIPVHGPGRFLYEPDGAVIRAHLVEQLAVRLNAAKISEDIAYLTAEAVTPTPFARIFAVEDHFPFQLKRLRRYLRERGIGRVTIKKRGSPLDPDTLQKQLRLQGEEHRIVFLTQVQGEPVVIVGVEITAE